MKKTELNKFTEQEADSLTILRATLTITKDILENFKSLDPDLNRNVNTLLCSVNLRISRILKREDKEVTEKYKMLTEKLLDGFSQSAKLAFMEENEVSEQKEGKYLQVEYKNEIHYALYQNGVYWLPRRPIGLKESELKVNGVMV